MKNKIRVLQIANDYLGTELYEALFNALSDIGVTNKVFVPICTGTNKKEYCDKNNEDVSSIIISPCFSELDRFLYYSKQSKVFKEITRQISVNIINVTHAHTLFSAGYTARELKKQYGIPYITAVRNVDVNIFFKKMKHLRGVGASVMMDAEKVIFLSPAYKREVLESYVPKEMRDSIERKSIVIPNGISEFFHSNAPNLGEKNALLDEESRTIKLMYAGEISKNKNLTETVDACKILMREGFDCKFIVVGDVKEKSCGSILNETFISYHAKCGHDELINYYRDSDIFVMPSHTETFGLVYAEALSQGLPVIYTRGQGFDGQFDEGTVGYSVSDKDAKELSSKIKMILKDYIDMSHRCVECSKRFDWNVIAKEYKYIYKEIMTSR